jgi:hypothetical protein
MKLTFEVLKKRYAVCQINTGNVIPQPPGDEEFWSLTVSHDETSVVLPEESADPSWNVEPGWRALRIEGPLDFGMKGVLATISNTLSNSGISLFVISTYDTDYVLVKDENLKKASLALINGGHEVRTWIFAEA